MSTSVRTIATVAILKVNMDSGKSDLIEIFVPFVIESLRLCEAVEVSLAALQDQVRNDFGLNIPQGALKTILARAKRRNLVSIEHGIYCRNADPDSEAHFAQARQLALRHQQSLIPKLIEHCKRRHGVILDQENAGTLLVSHFGANTLGVLDGALNGSPIAVPDRPVENAEFLISSFAAELYEQDPEGFSSLETVVKGMMLADALVFPEIGQVSETFKNVQIYLDTEFLLLLLGYEGSHQQLACTELIALLKQENATLCCFEHTVDELRGILERAQRGLRKPVNGHANSSRVLDHYRQEGRTPSDVRLEIERLELTIKKNGIRIKSSPNYTYATSIDEKQLEQHLKSTVGYKNNPDALAHDIKSLTAVNRLRKGAAPTKLESCSALFVTTNNQLAKASTEFFRRAVMGQHVGVPHCLSYHYLTTIVWLKKPLVAPDLPRQRIIANAYAALNPDDHLWRKYLNEIDRLMERNDITEHDYSLLKYSTEARNALMDVTQGDDDAFAEGTVDEVLARARAHARESVETELRDSQVELERERLAHADVIAVNQQLLIARDHDRVAQLQSYRNMSNSIAHHIALIAQTCLAIFLLTLTYLTLPPESAPLSGTILGLVPNLVMTFAFTILVLLSVISMFNGNRLQDSVQGLEDRLSNMIYSKLVARLGRDVV